MKKLLFILLTTFVFLQVNSQERVVRNYSHYSINDKSEGSTLIDKGQNTFIITYGENFDVLHITQDEEAKYYIRTGPITQSNDQKGNKHNYFLFTEDGKRDNMIIIYLDPSKGIRVLTMDASGKSVNYYYYNE